MARVPLLRATVIVVGAAWLAVGLAGAYGYAHRYLAYRGFARPTVPAGTPGGSTRRVTYFSPALHARSAFLVHLPAGYARAAAAGRRFPVLYVLHGHPGQARDILQAGAIGTDLDALVARHRARPMILVVPEVATGPLGGADSEWADTPHGRYEQAVVDVVRAVDARFATRRDRAGRVLAGLSSGAYGAANVTLHHLGLFGGLESWSGYFVQRAAGAFAGAGPALLAANSPELYVPALAGAIRRLGLRAYLYVGRADHPARLYELPEFAAELRAAGALVRVARFPGGHDWALWRREMPRMLRVASRWFGSSPGRSPAARAG